jgi:hypothetical protein
MSNNSDFYRALIRMAGEPFGIEAKTSDDGSVQEDVLVMKVPELVKLAVEQLKHAEARADTAEREVARLTALVEAHAQTPEG